MKIKIIHFVILSLLITLCGGEANDDQLEATTPVSDQQCLSASEIEEIELKIRESEISLDEGIAQITASELNEGLNTTLEELQSELTQLQNIGNENSEYIEELNKQIENLKIKTGVNYDDIDFENFGQDSIFEELYNGTINILESKSTLTEEEEEELVLAQDKANLLNATMELYYIDGNDNPRVSQLEKEIIEIQSQINDVSPNNNSQNNEEDLEEIQEFITSQKNLLSSLPLCEDIVISADGDNEDVIEVDPADSLGSNTSFYRTEGCYDIEIFGPLSSRLLALYELRIVIEAHLNERLEDFPEDRKDEYEREAEYDFIENIDLGSLDKIVISDTKIKNLLKGDRLKPTTEGLTFIRSYLDQTKEEVEILKTKLLPLCGEGEIGKEIGSFSDEESSLTSNAGRSLNINRLCDIENGNLNCSTPNLYKPQLADSCDASVSNNSFTDPQDVERFFPTSIYRTEYMRRSFGTRYADNQNEIYFNPEVIFADEATQVTIVDDKSSKNGLTKLELEDSFSSSQKGNSEKAYVYDDGTHGDTVKGDGVYTNNCITVAKTINFNNGVYEKINKLYVLDPALRNSEEIYQVSENVVLTDSGMFLNIGYDYTQYDNFNNPIVFSPNDDSLLYRYVFKLFDDNINMIVIKPREEFSRGHMMRLNDHIRGTGFYHDYYLNNGDSSPAKSTDLKYGPWIDGKAHMELQAVLMMGDPTMSAFLHEYEHSIFGQTDGGVSDPFPAPNRGSLSDDGQHLTPHTTAINSLQGGFKILMPDGRNYKNVKMLKNASETVDTKLVFQDGKFKVVAIDSITKHTSDIFLYAAGVMEANEVSETYYNLVNPSIQGCIETKFEYICNEDNEVFAEEVISWDIGNYIEHFGPRSYAYGDEPKQLNVAIVNIAERPFSEAEIVFNSGIQENLINSEPDNFWRDYRLSMNYAWDNKANANINLKELLLDSSSYIGLNKIENTKNENGSIKVSNIDLYKELFFKALEDNSLQFIEEAIELIPNLPHAYLVKGLIMEKNGWSNSVKPEDAYNSYTKAYDVAKSINGSNAFLNTVLNERVNINRDNGIDKAQLDKDLLELKEFASAASWESVALLQAYLDELTTTVCFANKEQLSVELKDCEVENIRQDPVKLGTAVDGNNPFWWDGNFEMFIRTHTGLANNYADIAIAYLQEGKEQESLFYFFKSLEILRTAVSYDPTEIWSRFTYQSITRIYENLNNHPALNERERAIAEALREYYFIKEKDVFDVSCERFKGTFLSGGTVGGADGRYYVADYYCGRPNTYLPVESESYLNGEYDFNFHTWEWYKVNE